MIVQTKETQNSIEYFFFFFWGGGNWDLSSIHYNCLNKKLTYLHGYKSSL